MKKLLVVASMLVLVGCSEDADQANSQAEYPYDVVVTDTHEEFELALLEDENTYYKAIRYLGEESEIDIQSSSRPFTSALYVGDDVYTVDVADIATTFTLEGNNPYVEEVLVNENIQEYENGVLSVTATFYYNDEHYELQVESELETDQASVNVENY
ncbi:hypothetical protein FLK61_37335 [Paenalkalicoccus suaedae]|uniref:Lipoprotein n=1 Tax=Paenalkalicoccus suaedae TaxID=2592382 RepID=A0A859FGY0_9BACI|nr:hypothetical protein [Paenalkalicoccus suaedae]QKS72301.1 hypothetical protein FLK61_37335 [Paenalkalicoccus suaedae]